MTDEALDPIPLSALQHWCYCPRQCALIHIEQVFAENLYTQRGQALPLFSDSLGLVGKADVVEFLPDGTPYPVEYKHGSRHKRADIAACDDVQLAAQALCLEEMFGRPVPEGALYYASSRRRRIVAVDQNLRAKTKEAIAGVRGMLAAGVTPPPLADDHCRACSLHDLCQPEALHADAGRAAAFATLFEAED